jgi:hypothetical protein
LHVSDHFPLSRDRAVSQRSDLRQAVTLFERMKAHKRGDDALVFRGQKRGKPHSDMALTKAFCDRSQEVTARGFRTTFRDWVAETTWPGELADAARAHVVSDKRGGGLPARIDARQLTRVDERLSELLRR